MEAVFLQRNPYHGTKVEEHKPFPCPSLDQMRENYDALLRGEYWIPRTPDDEVSIQSYKRELRESGQAIEDEIRLAAGDSGFVFMKNRFPYHVRDADHYVLWILNDEAFTAADEHVRQFIQDLNIQPDEVICYENNSAYQTASGIPHFQIYIPRR